MDKKTKKKFKVPYLRLRYQICLYIVTLIMGGAAIFSSGNVKTPIAVRSVVSGAAFVLLVISVIYISKFFLHDVNKIIKKFIKSHPLLDYLDSNYRERTFMFAVPGFTVNCLFAAFNLFIGIRQISAWYITLAVYYMMLGMMRFRFLYYEFFARRKKKKTATRLREWKLFFQCGWLLILMSIVLCGMVILMVNKGAGKEYPAYIIYVVAMYTFMKVFAATANMIKARKYKSPQIMGVRNIGYADALVSILSLQTAMFAMFDEGNVALRTKMNGITGTCVCVIVILIGIAMVCSAGKELKNDTYFSSRG